MFGFIEDKFRQLDGKFTDWFDKKFHITEKNESFYNSYQPSEISGTAEYLSRIEHIKWLKYWSYSSSREIPRDLKKLLNDDIESRTEAATNLFSSLCHQLGGLSPASLPAYDFLILIFKINDQEIENFSPGPAKDEELPPMWPTWLRDQEAQSSGVSFAAWSMEKLSLSEAEYLLSDLLWIFYGFAASLSSGFMARAGRSRAEWEESLNRNLIRDRHYFERYRSHPCDFLSDHANNIIEELHNLGGMS